MKDFILHPEEFVNDMCLISAISIINRELTSGCKKDQTLNLLKNITGLSEGEYLNYLIDLKDKYTNILNKRNQN